MTIGVCAHRGDNKCAPENTVPAFELAASKGAHQIELDVDMSADGRLAIMHDTTVDRTTNGSGPLKELQFEQLRRLDAGAWKGPQWAGTRIPKFREAIQAIPEHIQVNCHIKPGTGIAAEATRQLVDMQRLDQCFLACSIEQAAEAKAVCPQVRICNMSNQSGPETGYAHETIQIGAEYIQLYGWHDCMPQTCALLRQHGITINYFGTSDPVFFRKLLEAGVQYPLTDDLDGMIAVLHEMGVPLATQGD